MEHANTRSESQHFGGGQLKENARGSGASAPSVSESVTRGKEAIGAAATDAMNSAGTDLQSLRSDLNSLKDTVAKFVSQAGGEAAKSAREVTSNLAGQVGSVASDVAGKSAEMASAASDQAKTFASELEGMARRNPIGAIAGALLVGVLIGVMGRRS
jgi:ElaB/YqjD/DUF883 family membrane-anchored ribosome-binding protein